MPVDPTTFEPTSHISNGNKGLAKKEKSHSNAKILGTGLSNDLDVVAQYPASGTATLKWTGKTKGSKGNGTECTVRLTQEKPLGDQPTAVPPGLPGETPTPVSVTVGNTPINPNPTVNIGTLPVCTTGGYIVQGNGTGGTKTVLTVVNGTVVLVDSTNANPNWTITLQNDNSGNSYTIKQSDTQYLCWSAGGSVTLGTSTDPGAKWQLANAISGTFLIKATCNPQQFLNGNASSGSVNVQAAEDPNGGTNWTLTPVEPL